MLALIAPLASLLGIEAEALKQRLQRQAILWALVALMAIIAGSFLLVAANAALSIALGPVIAPLVIAGASLFVGLAIYVVWQLLDSAEARREAERRRGAETTAMLTTATLTALPLLLSSPLMKRIGIPVGGALAAAWLLTRPKSRDDN